MKNLESSKEKIQDICNIIKQEAIEPAHQQAKEIVENAKIEAEQLVKEAKKHADELQEQTRKELAAMENQVLASLRLAGREAISSLKEKIETALFSPNLKKVINEELSKESVIADLIQCLIQAISKEGIDGNLIAYLGKNSSPEKVNEYLVKKGMESVREQKLQIGDFEGGVKLSISESKITLDMSDEALFELFTKFLQKDFQALVFGEEKLG